MAQYYDIFEGYDAGDITSNADWEGAAFTVVHGQDTSYLERTDEGSIAWTVETGSDVETVIKARFSGECNAGPAIRAQGGSDSSAFSQAYSGNYSTAFAPGNRIFPHEDGNITSSISGDDATVVDETSWFWVRCSASSDSIEHYIWQDGESEPSTPQLAGTDATYSSGYGGIHRHSFGGGTLQVDSIGVGTEGDTAPTSPVSADPPAAPTNLQLSEQ